LRPNSWRLWAAALTVLVAACHDDLADPSPPTSRLSEPLSANATLPPVCRYTSNASRIPSNVTVNQSGQSCRPTVTLTPASMYIDADPGRYPDQTGDMTIVFSEPVWVNKLYLSGFLYCDNFGSVKLYSGTSLKQTVNFTIRNAASDCPFNDDNVAGEGDAPVTYTGSVTKIVITAPSPLVFLVPNCCDGSMKTAYGFADYTIYFYETQPPPSCPPFGDQWLDTPGVAKIMEQILQQSLADPNHVEIHREGWFDTTQHTLRVAPPVIDSAGPCNVWWRLGGQAPNEVLGFIMHTHARMPTDTLLCPDRMGRLVWSKVNYSSWGGASKGDWATVDSLRSRLGYAAPSYMISPTEYVRIDPGVTDTTLWRTSSKRWRRDTTCVLP
jgi:hypothetical protein